MIVLALKAPPCSSPSGLPCLPQCGRDGGYDSQAFLDLIRASGAKACIPTPRDRIVQRSVPNRIYRQRNRVERYFCKMKHFRCAATRFDKLARSKLIPRHLSWQRKRTPRVGGKAAGVGRPIRDGLWQRAAYSDRRSRRAATSARNSPVSSTGQRNTYLDRRTWSDDDEARISQDEGFGG